MTHIYRCDIELLETTFFSSREVGNTYYTEPFIGNYALAYALGFAQAPYYNDGSIHYREHLSRLNEDDVYVTPATIAGAPAFTFDRFNAQPDAYWFAFTNNAIVTRPDGGWVEKSGRVWYVHRPGEGRRRVALENRPQFGRIRALATGNRASAYVVSRQEVQIPRYVRLGKFMSKARIDTSRQPAAVEAHEQVTVERLLNPADLPGDCRLAVFDLLNVPPAPLVRNSVLSGDFYALPGGEFLPVGMRFGVEGLP